MLTRINKAMAKKDSGFTLIELLVVVIIIGILAAIAIPTFLNQRQAGFRGQVESDLRNAATAVETLAVENNGEYGDDAGLTGFFAEAANFNFSDGVSLTNGFATATDFCVTFQHADLGADRFYFMKSAGEPLDGTCTTATTATAAP